MNERERQLIYDALCEVLFYAEDNGGYYQCNYSVDEIKRLADKYKQQVDNEDLREAAEEFADKNVAEFSKTVKADRDKEQKCIVSHLTSGDWQQIKTICFRAFIDGFEWRQKQVEIDLDKEIGEKVFSLPFTPSFDELDKYARYFYELGRRAEQ